MTAHNDLREALIGDDPRSQAGERADALIAAYRHELLKFTSDMLFDADEGTCGCGCRCAKLVDPEYDCPECHGQGTPGRTWCGTCGIAAKEQA